jgi:polysaccharide chain length determinant protein (PEP-CTERM system associated)
MLLSRENLLTVIRETDMDLQIHTPEDRDRLVASLASSIQLSGGARGKKAWEPNSNIYEISYQTDSAQRAHQVVSNLLNIMIESTLNASRTDTALAQKFLEKQIADFEQRLSVAEGRLAKFKKANVGYMPDERGGYYARLQRAEEALEETRSALRLAQRRHSELRKQLSGEKPLMGSASYESAAATKLREYQRQLEALLAQYTEQHPDVQALRSQIADLKANEVSGGSDADSAGSGDSVEFNPVYQELKIEISKASVEVETLKIQLSQQEKILEDLRQSIDAMPEVEARLAQLNRDYEVTRERYVDLVERRESARLAQDAGQSGSEVTFRIIEPPVVPTFPSAPNRLLLLAGVFVAAVGAGLGWGALRYLLHPTFINLRQLRHSVALPVLGSVSLYLTPAHRRKRRMQLASFLASVILLIGVFGGVVWYRDTGAALIGGVVSGVSLSRL